MPGDTDSESDISDDNMQETFETLIPVLCLDGLNVPQASDLAQKR